MSVLNDDSIQAAVATAPSLASGVDSTDTGKRSSKIQPASLDLTIGQIYVPGRMADKLGGINNPYRKSLALEQGHTAFVVTKEELDIPNDVAAIGFPPSSVSRDGLLMTNPGHVDPGYKGHMSFTVINMGRKPYELQVGARIVTLIFMSMNRSASVPFGRLHPIPVTPPPPVDEEVLERLSADFMDIEERAKTIANQSVLTAQWTPPLISAALAALATFIISIYEPWTASIDDATNRIIKLESRLDSLGGKFTLGGVEKRLKTIEQKLDIKAQD